MEVVNGGIEEQTVCAYLSILTARPLFYPLRGQDDMTDEPETGPIQRIQCPSRIWLFPLARPQNPRLPQGYERFRRFQQALRRVLWRDQAR
jgi:hypothetical protein